MSSAKEQCELLMGELVEFAKKMLRSYGEYHPFGGYLTEGEQVVHVGLSSDVAWTSEQHRFQALSESLRALVHQKQPVVLGIATNVSLPSQSGSNDAIRVFLEHRSGYCAEVFFHYQLAEGLKILKVTAQQGEPFLFQ